MFIARDWQQMALGYGRESRGTERKSVDYS
jgi:hypothetical protein